MINPVTSVHYDFSNGYTKMDNNAIHNSENSSDEINKMDAEIAQLKKVADQLLKDGSIMLAIAYIFATLQLQDQEKLANTAKLLNNAASTSSTQSDYVTYLKDLINAMMAKQDKDHPNPTIDKTQYKNSQKMLDKMNEYLKGIGRKQIGMNQFNALNLKTVQFWEADAEKSENNAGALKSQLQTQVQMQESQFQTVTQYMSSILSGLKSLSSQISQAIGH